MQLINPNPRKDWRIGQECFYFINRLNMIGKAAIAGVNPATEKVHLYDSRFETDFDDDMNCIFETQDGAMQALREQVGRA